MQHLSATGVAFSVILSRLSPFAFRLKGAH